MFAVIFTVHPKPGRQDDYLKLAGQLKPELEKIDGFIDNERFGSKRRPGWVLSLSTWRDEKSLIRWRTHGGHHAVQERGRFEVFEDYHLQVGEIVADTQPPSGQTLAEQRFDETETGAAKFATLIESRSPLSELATADNLGLVGSELFESIYNPGKFLLLNDWRDAAAAAASAQGVGREARVRRVRVVRDYGRFARAEAPQYFPPVEDKAAE